MEEYVGRDPDLTPRWLQTILTSLGAVLTGALLLWVASSQLTIVTEQAVIKNEIEALTTLMVTTVADMKENQSTLRSNQNNIWPRLRSHGENAELLRREVEKLCNCSIKFTEPDKF